MPKYLKFAYSAHFGFNVMRSNISIDEAACDSMLTFVVDGAVLVRRVSTKESFAPLMDFSRAKRQSSP